MIALQDNHWLMLALLLLEVSITVRLLKALRRNNRIRGRVRARLH